MKTFKIIEVTDTILKTTYFKIQMLGTFKWKDVVCIECNKKKVVTHDSYELAEKYLKDNYISSGKLYKDGNVYIFEPYSNPYLYF